MVSSDDGVPGNTVARIARADELQSANGKVCLSSKLLLPLRLARGEMAQGALPVAVITLQDAVGA